MVVCIVVKFAGCVSCIHTLCCLICRSNQLEQQTENERIVDQLTRRQAELAEANNHIELMVQRGVNMAEEIEVISCHLLVVG